MHEESPRMSHDTSPGLFHDRNEASSREAKASWKACSKRERGEARGRESVTSGRSFFSCSNPLQLTAASMSCCGSNDYDGPQQQQQLIPRKFFSIFPFVTRLILEASKIIYKLLHVGSQSHSVDDHRTRQQPRTTVDNRLATVEHRFKLHSQASIQHTNQISAR